MVSTLDRLTYAARQTARVAWYAGHYAAGRRLLKPMPKPDFPIGPTPSRAEMTADMRALFEREWQDIEAGLFPAPRARGPEPAEFLRRSLLYFRDLPQVDARRHGTLDDELPPGQQGDGLPEYYRQNFHFQSDGWLSEHSAAIYDTQVEVLFTGAADVMRRRCIQTDRPMDGRAQPARLARPRCRLRHRPAARLPARCLARPAAERPRSQRAVSFGSAPSDRPHRTGQADRRRGGEAAVRRSGASTSSSPRS